MLLPWLLESARCVLVPLWAVPQWAAAEFLEAFHRALTAGSRPHKAFGAARKALAKHPDWCWATWQVCGDTRSEVSTSAFYPRSPDPESAALEE